MNVLMMKQLFVGLLVVCCCLTLLNAEPREETEALPFSHAGSVSFNPIDFFYPQQLQPRLLQVVNCFSGQRVVNLCQQVQQLDQSVAAGSASFRALSRSVSTSLAEMNQIVRDAVNDLSRIPQSFPSCPSSAPSDSKVVGTYCYWIGTTKLNFADASSSCLAGGGILAEPLPAFGPSLYTALLSAFPAEFGSIGETSDLWIGADNYDDNVDIHLVNRIIYLTTNQGVPGEPSIELTDPLTTHYGAILKTTPNFDFMSLDTLNNYVCQSSTV